MSTFCYRLHFIKIESVRQEEEKSPNSEFCSIPPSIPDSDQKASLRARLPFDLGCFLYLAACAGRAGPRGSGSWQRCPDATRGDHLLQRIYCAQSRRSCSSLLVPTTALRGSGPWPHFTEDKRGLRGSRPWAAGQVDLGGRAGLLTQVCLAPEPVF